MKRLLDSLFVFFCFCGGGFFYKYKNKSKAKGNVLLIHGFLVNNLTFRPMASFLNKQGYNVYLPKLGWNIWKLEEQVGKLQKYWEKQKVPKDTPLYVIGHSMGGIIAHTWVKQHKIKPEKLITLGTPFLGSKIVYYFIWYFFPATKCLLPRKTPANYIVKHSDFEQVNVIAQEDLLVEEESGLCDEVQAKKIHIRDTGGHAGLVVDKKAFREVLKMLT